MTLPITDPVVVVAIVAGIIVVSPLLLERYGIPGMIGILVAGALLGENALRVLVRDDAIVLLGTMGLIYIMFAAALEIDLAILKRSRVQSIGFGLLTFALPQVVGTLVFRFLLGFSWPAAILVASMFASHTLLAYPVASRLGLAKHKAVTATLGATIVTDTLALLVLAVIASTADGELSREFWLTLGLSMAIFVAGVFILVPLLARWFFRHIKPDGPGEFVFVLATVFTCAGLSHAASLEPIIGAFLAGLALNRSIPHSSILMNRITFTGDALFVPFFLLSVGMLLDLRIFFGGLRSWLISLAMVGCVFSTKYLAAEAARLIFGYKPTEAKVMFGLSLAQAAATLAVVMVGVDLTIPGQEEPGIFYPYNSEVLNGAILMMLVTCVMAPIIVSRHGRKLALAQERNLAGGDGSAPQRILVSLAKAETAQPLLDLGLLLRDDGQQQPIYPFTVVRDGGAAGYALGKKAVAYAEKMLSRAVVHCTSADVPTHPLTRIDVNVVAALGRARRELRITDILIGWSPTTTQDRLFGSSLDHLLEDRECTIWRARFQHPLSSTGRVLFCVPPHALHEPGFPSVASSVKLLANRLGAGLVIWVTTMEAPAVTRVVNALKPQLDHETRTVDGWSVLAHGLSGKLSDLDLLVLYGARAGSLSHSPAIARVPNRIAGRFQDVNLLVVYPPDPPEVTEAPLGTERTGAEGFLREEQIVFGLGNLTFVDALATVLDEGAAGQGVAALPAEEVVPDLVSSAAELVPGIFLATATAGVEEPLVLAGASSQGISMEDGGSIHLIFVVLEPPHQESQPHLDRLADIAHLGRAPGLVDRIRQASGPDDVLAAFRASGPRRQTGSLPAAQPPATEMPGSPTPEEPDRPVD